MEVIATDGSRLATAERPTDEIRMTALLIGAVLAITIGLLGTVAGMDRDRAFYAVAMMVIASYYVLFALMGASTHVLMLELGVGAIFIVAAVAGFRTSLWLVVIALAAHGVFDLTHGMFITNPGVPVWWPAFCLAYDVMAAAYLSWLLLSGRTRISA